MEDTKVKFYIEADGNLRVELARAFGKSLPTVCRALDYSCNNDVAKKIRVLALKKGAVKMEVKQADIQKA